MKYMKIPRNLIYDKELGDKRIIVYSSILFSSWSENCCNIDTLIDSCDYVRKRMAHGIEWQFKNIITSLNQKGYVSIQGNLEDAFSFCIKTPKNSFGIISKFEYEQIFNYRVTLRSDGKRINHAHLLLLLSYIRLNMDKRIGYPMMHFSMLKTISDNTGLSVRSITAALKILEELSIIHGEELPRYKDKYNNWHSNVKVFVNMKPMLNHDTNYDWRNEVAIAIEDILCSQREYIGG